MKIFMIGIGGIAMGNLAKMLLDLGHDVSGSDKDLYPPMSDKLQEWGLKVFNGFSEKDLGKPDLVIVGNAISRGNPQVEKMLAEGMNYMSMPAAISEFLLKGKKVIIIAGTHGKTTTTFLTHHLLKEAGLSPGLFVGGIRADGHAGFELGKGEYFVIEGDEYDSAFFDKGSKFLHYRPYILGLNALDFDHADIFTDISAIQVMFKRLLNITPRNGKIFYYKEAKHLEEICKPFPHSPTESFAINQKESILKWKNGKLQFTENSSPVTTNLIGEHNYRNLELALRICKLVLGKNYPKALKAISSFPGVKRRQEILFKSDSAVLMEDFAHHPVAIEETIKAVKSAYKGYTVISLFEPRSATSHRNVFQKEFALSFKGSDYVLITELFNKGKVAEEIRLNVRKLVKDTKKLAEVEMAIYNETPKDILSNLEKIFQKMNSKKKLIVLAMSNGAFGGIYPQLTELLKKYRN
jgi:UDP-N-acetylmuramate: L-alanyl-gamma-D-glutamyl-meso-diaminopimelate ligase